MHIEGVLRFMNGEKLDRIGTCIRCKKVEYVLKFVFPQLYELLTAIAKHKTMVKPRAIVKPNVP